MSEIWIEPVHSSLVNVMLGEELKAVLLKSQFDEWMLSINKSLEAELNEEHLLKISAKLKELNYRG